MKVSIPADNLVKSSACLPVTPPNCATVPASSRVLSTGSPRSFASAKLEALTLSISPAISFTPCCLNATSNLSPNSSARTAPSKIAFPRACTPCTAAPMPAEAKPPARPPTRPAPRLAPEKDSLSFEPMP